MDKAAGAKFGSVGEVSIRRVGLGSATVDYHRGWELQRRLHARRATGTAGDVVLLLEHDSVYTAGRRTEPRDRPAPGSATEVVEVDRGGKITWHGPGQLVVYPIVRLPSHVYVVDFIRRLEEAVIRACGDLGLATGRVAGRSGVWVVGDGERPERKVAAVGVRVARGITMHGAALNCDNSLAPFDAIVPCGIQDAGVTTLSAELGRDVAVLEAAPLVERQLRDLLSWAPYQRSPDLRHELVET